MTRTVGPVCDGVVMESPLFLYGSRRRLRWRRGLWLSEHRRWSAGFSSKKRQEPIKTRAYAQSDHPNPTRQQAKTSQVCSGRVGLLGCCAVNAKGLYPRIVRLVNLLLWADPASRSPHRPQRQRPRTPAKSCVRFFMEDTWWMRQVAPGSALGGVGRVACRGIFGTLGQNPHGKHPGCHPLIFGTLGVQKLNSRTALVKGRDQSIHVPDCPDKNSGVTKFPGRPCCAVPATGLRPGPGRWSH
jgi:hypothetical protein